MQNKNLVVPCDGNYIPFNTQNPLDNIGGFCFGKIE